ncbi:MAG TPA: right-handed parallel beta-helix repeat-containing protein [Xanthomonadaceae bacterium]|nr:right-handed parallel beta-helix repeat-containing protein [Xanthomonadaceae bacterium]
MPRSPFTPAAVLIGLALAGPVAAGSLVPPGPPGPVYKSLGDIEPRDFVRADSDVVAALVIDQPGSYYLTGEVMAIPGHPAITISASHVTLDLNGFSVRGNPEVVDGHGIFVTGRHVTIRNGVVREADGSGIACGDNASVILLEVSALDNGVHGAACARLRVVGGEFSNNDQIGLVSLGLQADGVRATGNGLTGVSMSGGSTLTRALVNSNGQVGINCVQGTSLVTQTVAKSNGDANRLGCVVFDSEIP